MSFSFSTNVLKFEDVRQQIIEFLSSNSEYSSTFDWSASNISYIIDTMSYVSMLMSYQISQVANNNFLETTNIRKNAVLKAKEIGYRPRRKTSAIIVANITYTDETNVNDKIEIPIKTVFTSNKGSTFYNLSETKLFNNGSGIFEGKIELTEGLLKNFEYKATNQTKFQNFIIPSDSVEENNLRISVNKNNLGITENWIEVKDIFNITTQKIYFVEEDSQNEFFPKVTFGDGLIGEQLTSSDIIEVNYLESQGSLANGEYIVDVTFSSGLDKTKLTGLLNNSSIISFGGKDNESIEDIKIKAPKHFSSTGRAVTRTDFLSILNSYPGIVQSNVIGGNELYPLVARERGNIYVTVVPLQIDFENFNSNPKIYITLEEERELQIYLNYYKIVSTNLKFMKPSYILCEVFPKIEFKRNITQSVMEDIKTRVKLDLETFSKTNFYNFNTSFRVTKILNSLSENSNVLSVSLRNNYYISVSQSSFESNTNQNILSIPISVESEDEYGQPTYTNFVKTNTELSEELDLPLSLIPYTQRTISGKITNDIIIRHIFNDDDVVNELSYLKVYGEYLVFSFIKNFNNTSDSEVRPNTNPTITSSVAPEINNGIDTYKITLTSEGTPTEIGTVKYTKPSFFKGFISSLIELPQVKNYGDYMEVTQTFALDPTRPNEKVYAGDFIYCDGTTWRKIHYYGEISAEEYRNLKGVFTHNTIFAITEPGNFGGLIEDTVEPGDYIIYNINTSNPNSYWEKMNSNDSIILNATNILPKAISDFELKLVILPEGQTTTFNDRISTPFANKDLVYFDPTEDNEVSAWKKIINIISSTDLNNFPSDKKIDANSDILDTFNYSTLEIGTTLLVVSSGNFNLSENIIWLNSDYQEAEVNDILLYIGNSRWKIFQNILSPIYEIDGTDYTALPYKIFYGDYFVVDGTGNFQNTSSENFEDTDLICYVGNNEWKKVEEMDEIPATSADDLPLAAQLGYVYKVKEEGVFEATPPNPSINLSGFTKFVDGDYIIFTGNRHNEQWRHLKEYSIEFTYTGKSVLNNLKLNSQFNLRYNASTRGYEVFFYDIFNNSIVGEFSYNSKTAPGEIQLFQNVVGNNNSTESAEIIPVKKLFASSIDLIRILPKNKTNGEGGVETDFDTKFNQFLIVNIQNPTTL